jgi:hypothetical protein
MQGSPRARGASRKSPRAQPVPEGLGCVQIGRRRLPCSPRGAGLRRVHGGRPSRRQKRL